MIGRTIGNYVVREKIGEGGMGVVYRAEHPHINRQVAIKVLHPGADRNPEVVHRFFNEARAATEIRNDHIVEVMDFGELPEGTPYLVMEWLEGDSLGGVLQSLKKLPVARAAHVIRGVTRALKAAHSKGVVHRDLKPDNVFLASREGERDLVKVLDFGIAKLLATALPVRYQTQTGAIIGTPAYMSPEQCRGAKEIDHRTDIYSLGVIGYQMLTGRLPFLADALGELLFKHMTELPPAPATLDPTVPAAVSDIIARALAKEPEKRPTLAEIAAVMDAVEAGGADFTTRPIGLLLDVEGSGPSGVASAATVSSALASNTTLGAAASEIGLERRLPRARRSGMIIASLVAAAVAAAAIIVLATHKPGPAAPSIAPAVATPSHTSSVAVAIRTEPDTARLSVDGQEVSNPFAKTVAADGRAHTVTATLAGFGSVVQSIEYDRDRELVLKLIPDAPAAAAAAAKAGPTAEPPGGRPPSGPPHARVGANSKAQEPTGPSADVRHAKRPGSGYRGSKLNIETEFPGSH